jgi:SAM-dependent methyltransferase
MLEIALYPRACECCGGSDLEPVWSSQGLVRRATNIWRFPVNVAVCRACGFCFASPGPKHEDLARYYAEGLAGYKEIGLPYSVDARMSVLERYRITDGVFAEIGGDRPGEFHRRCAPLFGKQLVVEVSDDTPAELRSVHDLAENSVDVLAHYDVLEHVAEVKDFLTACHRALKPGGVMICEVPDMRLYPRNLLLLECEHVNHFSAATLTAIARLAGLSLVELEHICSRPYGFLSVFRKEEASAVTGFDTQCEFIDALACVRGGIEQIRRNDAQIQALRQRITMLGDSRQKVTLWAVTELLRRLLDNYKLPDSAIVVDSDPRRINHLEQEGILVSQPKDCIEHIAHSELLVICAPRYKSGILDWVAHETGKTFAGDALAVIGAGPSGETLT